MAPSSSLASVGHLLARFRDGDREAADQLFLTLYPELKRLAAAKMKAEKSEHSWQPSLLVNELYLRLLKASYLGSPAKGDGSEREHFLQFAGQVMRQLLIDHSRLLATRSVKIDIAQVDFSADGNSVATLQEMDELLERLAAIHPRLRSIVEMKVFEGLTVESIAERLELAPRTVARNWAFSREWLREEMKVR